MDGSLLTQILEMKRTSRPKPSGREKGEFQSFATGRKKLRRLKTCLRVCGGKGLTRGETAATCERGRR